MKKLKDMTPEERAAWLTPEFSEAMRRYVDACKRYGEESEQARNLFSEAMLIAPPAFEEEAKQMAREMGLFPEADGYLEDGTPVFNLETIAKHLNKSREEVAKEFQRLNTKRAELGLPEDGVVTDPSKIFRKQ
jgi:Mn-dependent DtxR family transcriptional regulator